MENNKKRQNILKRIEGNFKFQILLCVVLCFLVIIAFFITNKLIDKKKFHEYNITEDIRLINSIENINANNSKLILDGYALILERDSIDSTISLFFLNTESSAEVWPDIEQVDRHDVNSYFSAEYNYENSGFQAYVDYEDIMKDECYEIFINIDYPDESSGIGTVRKTVSTNQFILDGQLYDYNPDEFDSPDLNVQSELLRKVFSDGKLYHYQKDAGMYIYQYRGQLYWIATSDFVFYENRVKAFPYIIRTSDASIPSDQRVQYLDFDFEKYEYKDEVTEPYRVAIRDIPNDFSITYITTGHYDRENGTWLWKALFHMDGLFSD